ncbi:MAG TPA: hypothetical protein VF057_07805 [Thermoanaerobaculia bacterium]
MRASLSLAALVVLAASARAESVVQHRFEAATAPSATVRRVIVDIPSGEIVIRNAQTNRIAVSGTVSREPDSERSRDKEQRIVNDTGVEIVVRRDEAVIRRKFGPNARSWRAQSFSDYDVVVELPKGLNVDVKTTTGDVLIEGSFGDIDVDLRAGEVDVRLPRADVRELRASCRIGEVRTNIGNEIVEREGVFPGQTRYLNPQGKYFVNVHTTVGEVRVELK